VSESGPELERIARRLLELADADGRLPTRVDEIVKAAGLVEADESLLSPGLLERAPAYLKRAMRGIIGRIRGVLDHREKEIHLDPNVQTDGRRRFIKLHEVLHHVLPWHMPMVRADTDETLSADARMELEMEASVGAAHVLFQVDRYAKQIAELPIGIGAIAAIAPQFGASLRAGLRRYVQSDRAEMLGFVLDMAPLPDAPLRYRRRELIPSPSYVARFGPPRWLWTACLAVDRFEFLVEAAAATATRNIAVTGEWRMRDGSGQLVTFRTEFYCTGYDILALLWIPPAKRRRKLRLVA
jgi:hypothetical protein